MSTLKPAERYNFIINVSIMLVGRLTQKKSPSSHIDDTNASVVRVCLMIGISWSPYKIRKFAKDLLFVNKNLHSEMTNAQD